MKRILDIVLEADSKAQQIIDRAAAEQARCEESIRNAAGIKEKYMQDAQKRVQAFEQEEAGRLQTECGVLDEKLTQGMRRLETLHRQNGDSWIDTMYRRITEQS